MNTTTNIITSLIGTCVGGAISYLVIYQSEKNKRKKEFELKAACKVLIPLGNDLEKLILLVTNKKDSQITLDKFFKELNQLSIYLDIKKNFFLKEYLKAKISKYLIMVNLLNENLTTEYKKSSFEYKNFILEILKEFYDSKEQTFITFNHSFENKLKECILKKKPFKISELIEKIIFLNYEESLEKRDLKEIIINNSKRADYTAVEYNLESKENLFLKNSDSFNLLKFFKEKIEPYEKKEIEKIINQTKSSEDLKKILIYLKNLKKDVVENIDKVKP